MRVSLKLFFVVFAVISSAFASLTYADDSQAASGIVSVLCHVIDIAQGNVGKTIATLIIISLAIGLFLGKVTWGVAIAVAVGMGILFGSGPLVNFLASGQGSNPCDKVKSNS